MNSVDRLLFLAVIGRDRILQGDGAQTMAA